MNVFQKIYKTFTENAYSDSDDNYQLFLLDVINKMIPIVEFTSDGIIVDANDSYLSMMACDLSEIKDKHHSVFIDVGYKEEQDYDKFWEDLRNGIIQNTECHRVRKDGVSIWIKAKYYPITGSDGKVSKVIKFATDVTDLKKSFLETEKQKVQLQAIVNTTIDGMITIDKNGIVLSFNPACEKIFGYSADEIIGSSIKPLITESYYAELDSYIKNYKPSKESKIINPGREIEGRRKNGQIFPLELSIADASFANVSIYSGIVRDISERKELERMKTEFVSVVSHELRTPLTSIMGSLGLISGIMSKSLPEKVNNLIEIARNNCKSLSILINDLLDIDKIASGKMRFDMSPESLSKLIAPSIDAMVSYAVKFAVNIENNIQDSNIFINVDPERFKQIIINLLSNAIKFSEKGGNVKLYRLITNGSVRICVEDYGSGIPKEFQNSIFQKFSQANSSDTRVKGGSGLGLHITKKIVESMQGAIGFISKPDKGTIFWVDFPIIEDKNDTIRYKTGELLKNQIEQVNNKHKILICEDNADIVTILKMQIEEVGYETDVAYNLTEAQRKIKTNKYSAITLDLLYSMGGSGLKFISQLREDSDTAKLPIIVVSIVAQDGKAMMNASAFGMIDWLQKPIDEHKLKIALDRAVSKK